MGEHSPFRTSAKYIITFLRENQDLQDYSTVTSKSSINPYNVIPASEARRESF